MIINDLFLCLTSSARLLSIFHRSLSFAALHCPTFTRNCPTCSEQSRARPVNDHSASAPETLSLFLERTTESDRAQMKERQQNDLSLRVLSSSMALNYL